MGCDIHIRYQAKHKDGWGDIDVKGRLDFHGEESGYMHNDFPLDYRSYSLFAFLAGVRNMSAIEPISKPRGLPEDMKNKKISDEGLGYGPSNYTYDDIFGYHSASWLSLNELLSYDYDREVEDRRYCKRNKTKMSGPDTIGRGLGVKMTMREFLGEAYFGDLEIMKSCGVERIVFCFDN